MTKTLLEIPCSYQGGKQRLAKQIVDIFYKQNKIDSNTKFYDLCCGSGAVTIELINRGFNPTNIIMIDNSDWGLFWQTIANNEFDLELFKSELDKLSDVTTIQSILKELSSKPVNNCLQVYNYLMLQAGSFGAKQIYSKDGKWYNCSFRSYWMPTPTSNRRSPVNPMMPMPLTLFDRVSKIVNTISGCIQAYRESVFDTLNRINSETTNNVIVYVDPPYINTTGYSSCFDVYELVKGITNDCAIYVSEGFQMSKDSILLSKGRAKGNISGEVKKKPTEEWLNKF